MGAAVVWCNTCKTAVWAYDALSGHEDVRGLMNMMSMPCPECGTISNFDGWNSRGQELENLKAAMPHATIYDWWSALKAVFKVNCKDGKWAISPDCKWFRRPNFDWTPQFSELIHEEYEQQTT